MLCFCSSAKDEACTSLSHTIDAAPLERSINTDEISGICNSLECFILSGFFFFFSLVLHGMYRGALLNTYWMSNKPFNHSLSTVGHKRVTRHSLYYLCIQSSTHSGICSQSDLCFPKYFFNTGLKSVLNWFLLLFHNQVLAVSFLLFFSLQSEHCMLSSRACKLIVVTIFIC